MQMKPSFLQNEKIYKWLAYAAILLGIIIRVSVYLQNRNLFIDEANVARNIYERGFADLATPLSYEQYAPPIFLWIVKFITVFMGFGEQAFRLYPLMAGVASLFVLYILLKELGAERAAWYAIGMMAIGYMYIRYSTELKQYISDVLVVLCLLLLAVKTDVQKTAGSKFAIIWLVAGSLAIWLSMPSVFILAGVAAYYFIHCIQYKAFKKMWLIAICGIVWLAQFGAYYKLILQTQAESSYLQSFHADYFLVATPDNLKEWQHNMALCQVLLSEAAGATALALVFNVIGIVYAMVYLVRKKRAVAALLILPGIALLFAAAINKFTLIPRVSLFIMPIILLLVAIGIGLMLLHKRRYINWVAAIIACVNLYNHNMIHFIWDKLETEEITDALDFVMENGINNGNRLYLHNGAGPAFIYYTNIHPEKEKWRSIKNADRLSWDADYNALAQWALSPSAFIFTSIYSADLANTRKQIEGHMKQTASFEKPGCYAFIYSK